jgi:hypothetical protein
MTAEVTLDSSDKPLHAAFSWAKTQALAYVFTAAATGDPVGDWYEAALPGRAAFCMRDVAHQSLGAEVLGLGACNYNMLAKFAVNIAESRDWCSYWEIDRWDRPAPIDYTSDTDFWYNLPANFDVLECCYRQYLWTGDRRYLDDPVFRNFYARTVDEYVRRWDKDGDGIPEHYAPYGRRGIASYNEDVARPRAGGDLLALQAAAYSAYAAMLDLHGAASAPAGHADAGAWRTKAQALRTLYTVEWWCEPLQRFACLQHHDGRYECSYCGITNFFPLYFNLIEDPAKAELALAEVIRRRRTHQIEERSYLPELFYAYGHPIVAREELLEQCEPGYARREYPEVSYAAIGSIVKGMLGIEPNAAARTVTTCSRLTEETRWVQLAALPCLGNVLDIRHEGQEKTVLANRGGKAFEWRAVFAGHHPQLLLDGAPQAPVWIRGAHGEAQSVLTLAVAPHATHAVVLP